MQIHTFAKSSLCFALPAFVAANLAWADFAPIPLTADSFNQDVVVEKTGPPPLVPATTASMEAGTNNTGLSFYEQGYKSDAPATGLPVAGAITTSALSGHQYQFAPTYKTNNAILVDSSIPAATLFFSSPSAFARLSFLVAGANAPGPLQFTIHHDNSATQSGTFTCPDWYFGSVPALTAYGRVDVRDFTFDSVTTPHPGLFARDITLVNSNSPVTKIDFNYTSGAGECALFAISGSTNMIDDFIQVTLSGYNADLVVEASATTRSAINGVTTASMDHGTVNTANTWYEQTYYSPLPATGLPSAGSVLTNTAGDHRYLMPASYAANNALVLEASAPTGMLTPASLVACSALSFLAAAGKGPVTVDCVLQHADGITETNSVSVPDWMAGASPARVPNGRVNLNNRLVDAGSGSPKLFAVDLAVTHSSSPITNVVLTFNSGGSDSRAVFFALSGSSTAVSGPRPVLAIDRLAGGNLRISSSQAGTLESATLLKSSNTVWQTVGPISSNVVISPATNGPAKFYRVRQ